MNAPVTRRAIVAAAGAALGAAALPAGIAKAVAATPPTFDPAAYVADLEAIGCRVSLAPPIRSAGHLGAWSYSIGSPGGQGFGMPFHDLLERWSEPLKACPDHGRRVTAYLADRGRAAS